LVANQGESDIIHSEIYAQIDSLDTSLRIPFLMHVQGFKYEEIAQELDLPLGTVKSRIFFARKRLQKALKSIYQADALVDILD
ncbi:MAG: sigma factor-like helix-turn-helix DNA-binding protein, partial [Bacteroidota bacterium]